MHLQLLFWMLLLAVYSTIATAVTQAIVFPEWDWGDEITTVLGVSIGVLLVFRNRSAYDRWWEARTLWGQLINESRNLAVKAAAFAEVDSDDRKAFAELLATFPQALRMHLRGQRDPLPNLEALFPEISDVQHRPGFISLQIFKFMNKWNRNNDLFTSIRILERQANGLLDVCGGCERIRNTPMVPSYRYMAWSSVILYCLVSPWPLGINHGWFAIPIDLLAGGFLLGMEMVAEAIEEPFGTDYDDLPLERYCGVIESFVRETLG
ncbi:hypothetical protein DTL21_12820 [Bremerella cremea]|uniref:Bestrophin n=1 Tax=Blastopirellula marina TaxID=124 RepID=A0A2S8FQD7_9BACT|nr:MULTISPECIES: bestrophin family ion channel [Pirellulaceae]PQO34403.1 hypothetical protein C5Y83_12815 [Blastopirellula marina]RCS46899.1 hypothetical protein DTL21_12820 [Bremerella cremea]